MKGLVSAIRELLNGSVITESQPTALAIPTDEEIEIARQAKDLLVERAKDYDIEIDYEQAGRL